MKKSETKNGTETDYDSLRKDHIVLLTKSESRMDRTNEMVFKLAESTDSMVHCQEHITDEYIRQIEALRKNRDEILWQNKLLLHLLDKFSNNPTTNVNIGQDDK